MIRKNFAVAGMFVACQMMLDWLPDCTSAPEI
jgi:hypothetical protein